MRTMNMGFQRANDIQERTARAAGGSGRSAPAPRVTREDHRARDIYSAFEGADTPEFQGTIGTRRRPR